MLREEMLVQQQQPMDDAIPRGQMEGVDINAA